MKRQSCTGAKIYLIEKTTFWIPFKIIPYNISRDNTEIWKASNLKNINISDTESYDKAAAPGLIQIEKRQEESDKRYWKIF